jgi:CspA family cold shock protein
MQGKVKWFNNTKGFGFILPDNETVDVFAHFSQIQMDGYKTLKTNQIVEFDLVNGEKGKQAQNIRPV